MSALKLSVVIPAYNEEKNIAPTVEALQATLREARIPYQIIVVDDNCTDNTVAVVDQLIATDPDVHIVHRDPPGGFGRAVRTGLECVEGDVVAVYMADQSDEPQDLIKCYEKIREGYDCVFGTRFSKHSTVEKYPAVKLIINRIVNRLIQLLFLTKHNDMTNAFKVYRTSVIRECGPYTSSHFNISIEMSLSALIRGYSIASVPINWHGRTWGNSNLRITQMGRRYLSVILKLFCERILIADDLIAERLARQLRENVSHGELEKRIVVLEKKIRRLEEEPTNKAS
jgi:dolichol-phosphate mannosyltransferase